MRTTIIRPKTREEWLELRKSGIGSSEVATIVGLNPFETPYQLWRRKRGIDPPQEESFIMKAGHYLEDAVAQFWTDATGRKVIKRSAGDWLIRRDAKPYMQVSPDRTYWLADRHTDKGILECKTTQREVDADDIPRHWFCQVQYQLDVAGYNEGSLAWLTQGREFGYKDIRLVPDFCAWLEEAVDRFYADNVVGGAEPSAMSVRDVLVKYDRATEGKVVEVGEDIYDAYNQLKELRGEFDALDRRKHELEDNIKVSFGDAEAISFGGETLATWKSAKESVKFDDKAFAAANPDLAKQYMKTVAGSRRFLLK